MHVVLARPTDDPAFAPERATAADVDAWIERASGLLARAFDTIAARGSWDNETIEAEAKRAAGQPRGAGRGRYGSLAGRARAA